MYFRYCAGLKILIFMHLQGYSTSLSVCLLFVSFQVCDVLFVSSGLISPFLSSGVLSKFIIPQLCGSCDKNIWTFVHFGRVTL